MEECDCDDAGRWADWLRRVLYFHIVPFTGLQIAIAIACLFAMYVPFLHIPRSYADHMWSGGIAALGVGFALGARRTSDDPRTKTTMLFLVALFVMWLGVLASTPGFSNR